MPNAHHPNPTPGDRKCGCRACRHFGGPSHYCTAGRRTPGLQPDGETAALRARLHREQRQRQRGVCSSCKRSSHNGRRCKRRDCRGYHSIWLGDQGVRLIENLASYDGRTVIVTITAPGVDVLPWDVEHCAALGPHKCSGHLGCRVVPKLAREFNEAAMKAWSSLWASVRVSVAEKFGTGRALLLAYVPEPQLRGVLHYHVVLGARSARDRAALNYATRLLRRRASGHGWGAVHYPEQGRSGVVKLRNGVQAAAYVGKYLTKAESVKGLTALVLDGSAPTRAVYVSTRLTRDTRCTMRNLRSRRYLHHLTGHRLPMRDVERALLAHRLKDLLALKLGAIVRSDTFPLPFEPPLGGAPPPPAG